MASSTPSASHEITMAVSHLFRGRLILIRLSLLDTLRWLAEEYRDWQEINVNHWWHCGDMIIDTGAFVLVFAICNLLWSVIVIALEVV